MRGGRETAGREALLEALKCRRYTRARLSRLLTHALLGVTQAELEGEETEKTTRRCEIILQDALDQYHEDTGRTATVDVVLYGHDAEKQ